MLYPFAARLFCGAFSDAEFMADGTAYDEWVPQDYLSEYYSELQEDERSTLKYFVEQIRKAPVGPVLCFGSGPTLHHVFLAIPRMTEVYLADYLPANLKEIDRWRKNEPDAHDWSPFVRYTLICESGVEPGPELIAERMEALREKIAGLRHADASLSDPLGKEYRGYFAAVLSPYCAEAATSDKVQWVQYCRNIASLVRPGGLFMTSTLRGASEYRAGSRFFPVTSIDETDLMAVLHQDFRADSVEVEVRELSQHASQGFSGILLARGIRT